MSVIKNYGLSHVLILFLAGFLASCSFTPPGPRALLKGEKLIRQGKYDQAIESLQTDVRLLPKNAQAWNFLGLAFHGAKKPADAVKAYRQALDLDHKLVAARYNLGCLYLEENDPVAAMDQLTSYTLVESRSVDGFLKLATAQLHAKRLDLAERTYKSVLELDPKNVEALNGLGVNNFQRRRLVEAQNCFNQALALDPAYGPAILNSAMLADQGFNNHTVALQKYKQYLALQPRPENWSSVAAMAGQLEAELHPQAERPVVTARSNPPTPQPSNPPALVGLRTNVGTRTTASKPNIATNPAVASANTGRSITMSGLVPVTRTSAPPPIQTKQPDLEVAQVKEDVVVKPAQDVAHPTSTAVETTSASKPEKRGILSRLNPFSSRPKTPDSIVVAVRSNQVKQVSSSNAPEPARELPPIPKYAYLSPAAPAPGNRKDAEVIFAQAVKAQTDREFARALSDYGKAIQADPAYFEAYYNQGLAAYELGVWKTSLTSFEYALALKPNFTDARYNFALALKQANYLNDAADQLNKILKDNPKDIRAHLSLGNLYAQKLNQPDQAREHYMQVLKTDPTHPKAAEIRYWLAAHPQ
jgi:tetratricopeptide (TPR) repeat protein